RHALLDAAAEALQDLRLAGGRYGDAAEFGDALRAQGEAAGLRGDRAGAHHGAGLAAAEIEDEARGNLDAPGGRLRIETTLEAVARVRVDAERAAGAGDYDRIE